MSFKFRWFQRFNVPASFYTSRLVWRPLLGSPAGWPRPPLTRPPPKEGRSQNGPSRADRWPPSARRPYYSVLHKRHQIKIYTSVGLHVSRHVRPQLGTTRPSAAAEHTTLGVAKQDGWHCPTNDRSVACEALPSLQYFCIFILLERMTGDTALWSARLYKHCGRSEKMHFCTSKEIIQQAAFASKGICRKKNDMQKEERARHVMYAFAVRRRLYWFVLQPLIWRCILY